MMTFLGLAPKNRESSQQCDGDAAWAESGVFVVTRSTRRRKPRRLDEHGVSVIDAVNNGHPATFAVLARALGIPQLAVLDGDDAGRGYCQSITGRDFDPAFIAARCGVLPAGHLEQQCCPTD
jgi:hypothetical protein